MYNVLSVSKPMCSKRMMFGCSKWSLRTSAYVLSVLPVDVLREGLNMDNDLLSVCRPL